MDGHRHPVTSADGTLAVLGGQGHDAIDSAPPALAGALERFFS